MTPIGGKLGDLIGRRNIVVIPGIICAVCGIAFAFVRSLVPLMILRLLIGFAQGAFTAAPYIIAGLINERKDVPKAWVCWQQQSLSEDSVEVLSQVS